MSSWLLILYLGTTPTGQPQFIIKPYDDELTCRYAGGQREALERLNDNYSVLFNCIEKGIK